MKIQFDKNTPIYIQIEEYIKLAIITGKYNPGEKIPSVREYATLFKINPNTINRSLLELEEQGFIKTQRTSGKYITEDVNVINKAKKEQINKTIKELINKMKELNVSNEEIIEMIKENVYETNRN